MEVNMWPFRRRSGEQARGLVARRPAAGVLTKSAAMVHSAVYRAISIVCTAMTQLPLRYEVLGAQESRVPDIVRRPDPELTRDEWTEQITLSLIITGEAYLRIYRDDRGNAIIARPLDPECVALAKPGRYAYKGVQLPKGAVLRASFLRPIGAMKGIGPLQAAMSSLGIAADLRAYVSRWFRGSGQPAGVLTSDSALTAAEAKQARDLWNDLDANGEPLPVENNPTRIKVLGKGLEYKPIMLNPAEALWLEQQAAVDQEVARVFGVPPGLMLVSPGSGTSLSYANVSQEWAGFVRFGLMPYVKKAEGLLSEALPPGHSVRYDVEGLLRADTTTRYSSYESALSAGWMTVDEVRRLEGLS